eukprot:GHRQ01040244.1.p1 GENE.GHRQ01040244.1~~GHRQ01040244.1.p1  ORF type:complete len:103 (-),score=17.19 GHRQ01040244.1:156-464(-)
MAFPAFSFIKEHSVKQPCASCRHIIEDRFQAIRAAIGTAAPGDVVLLAGRGHRDHVEHFDGEDGIARGWFDDRWAGSACSSVVAALLRRILVGLLPCCSARD